MPFFESSLCNTGVTLCRTALQIPSMIIRENSAQWLHARRTCVSPPPLKKDCNNLVFTSKIQWHVNCLISQMKLNVIKTTVGLIWSIIMLYKLNENCFFPKLQFIKITDIKIRYYKITWSMYTLIAISNSLIFLSKQQFIRMPKGYIRQLTWLIFPSFFSAPVRNLLSSQIGFHVLAFRRHMSSWFIPLNTI